MIKLKKKINLKNLSNKKNSDKKNKDQTWLENKNKREWNHKKKNQFYKSYKIIK
jgi:hypothetical protein